MSKSHPRSCENQSASCCHGVFYDIRDGNIYQSDEYFKQHKSALSLVLYHDELEVCNPIDSNAGINLFQSCLDLLFHADAA